jgi:hypothetical protein
MAHTIERYVEPTFEIEQVDGTIVLRVENPMAVAERCWDAGLTIRVHEDVSDESTISVLDGSGLRIELVAKTKLSLVGLAHGQARASAQ